MKAEYYYISYIDSGNMEVRGRVIENIHPLQWAIRSASESGGRRFTIVWWAVITKEEFDCYYGKLY